MTILQMRAPVTAAYRGAALSVMQDPANSLLQREPATHVGLCPAHRFRLFCCRRAIPERGFLLRGIVFRRCLQHNRQVARYREMRSKLYL